MATCAGGGDGEVLRRGSGVFRAAAPPQKGYYCTEACFGLLLASPVFDPPVRFWSA
jgi:hypothetical protein